MNVTVEGTVMSVDVREKDGKKYTNIFLHQGGPIVVPVRIQGDKTGEYTVYEKVSFSGRLQVFVNDGRPNVSVYVG